jgi:hypothetical protein
MWRGRQSLTVGKIVLLCKIQYGVLIAVLMKIQVFWDVTLSRLINGY